ncbi:MAG TPA: HAD-IIIA family hydrolase [Terriglobales bacterium]|nr:HAD-IIIA family hydrolase [Terriglobales bacterium]
MTFASMRKVQDTEQQPNTGLLRVIFSEERRAARGPAIFIDRDGVINCRRPDDYVLNWSQFNFTPGIREALKQIASLELPMIVISNQAAVGKGLLDRSGLQEITARMHQALAADGTFLAAAYYCTHRPDENCACRKPKPELLYRAAEDFDIDLSRSIFIGDSDTDVQAARAAGCAPALFGSDIVPQPAPSTNLLTARRVTDIYTLVAKYLQAAEHA